MIRGDDARSNPIEDMLQAIRLTPGVVSTACELHFRGGRSGEVLYQIDGIPVRDPLESTPFTISTIALAESEVLTGGFDAEYGNAQSGIVEMTTRDGGEKFAGEVSYETDRMRFIGRGGTLDDPEALRGPAALFNSAGAVLDPIVSVRHRITLDPEGSVTVNIVTGVAETRELCLGLVEKYQDPYLADRVFDLAWTHSQVLLRQINATEADAQLYASLAGTVIYANPSLRADAAAIARNRRGQSGLWGYAISGDLPIVLVQIAEPANLDLVRHLVQAHAYWRLKGLAVDLVIWNEEPTRGTGSSCTSRSWASSPRGWRQRRPAS